MGLENMVDGWKFDSSQDRVLEFLVPHAPKIKAIDIADRTVQPFGCTDYHNPEAKTVVVTLSG